MVAVDLATGDAPEWVTTSVPRTIWRKVVDAGLIWQKSTGRGATPVPPSDGGSGGRTVVVTVTDPGCRGENSSNRLIERSRFGVSRGVPMKQGRIQRFPQPGASWRPVGEPIRYPHEYVRVEPQALDLVSSRDRGGTGEGRHPQPQYGVASLA